MKDKLVFITGATSGLGKAAAFQLGAMGARLVFTSRTQERGEAVREEFLRTQGCESVEMILCDLASFSSIRNCCSEFLKTHNHIDVLINNAGVFDFSRRESHDGIEYVWAVNFLAPFLLTNLLLSAVTTTPQSRILNVVSGAHAAGRIHFDDLEMKKGWRGFKAYAQSKLALLLFTRELARRLFNTTTTVNAYTPGLVATEINRHASVWWKVFYKIFGKSAQRGATGLVHLASSPERKGTTMGYFRGTVPHSGSELSRDLSIAERLWNIASDYVGA